MIDLIALSAAKKHADLLAMGLTSVSVDNTNKSITFTLAADGSQRTIYFDQPSDGVSIIGVEIKNGHLICLMSDGSEIDAGVLPSGSGSGGSIPKPLTYDYMPEGYPSKSVQTVTLMEEQEVEFAFDSKKGVYAARLTEAPAIAEGQTYTVNWDGTEYKCICSTFNTLPILGNLSIMGDGDDTGEPFIYIFATRSRSFVTLDISASHTISVKTAEEVITPMAEEFTPPRIVEAIDAVGAVANAAQTTANAAQTTAENVQRTASAKFQLMQQNTVTTTTTIGTIKNSAGSVPVKGLNIAVGSTIKFTADNNVSGKTVWDSPVKNIRMQNSAGVTICSLRLELSHDGETYNFINETLSSALSNLVIEYEKVIIPKLTYPTRNEGAWLPPYLIANCLYLTKQSTSSSDATLYRITVDNSGTLTAKEVT